MKPGYRLLLLLHCVGALTGAFAPARCDPLAGSTLRGAAFLEDGHTPWSDASVFLRQVTDQDDAGQLVAPMRAGKWTRETRTDAAGRFAFAQVAPGEYVVQVRDRSDVLRNRRVTLRSGEKATELAISMPALSLSGIVLRYSEGPPVASARVQLERWARQGAQGIIGVGSSQAETDAEGRFTFSHLEEGEYQITVNADGIVPSRTVCSQRRFALSERSVSATFVLAAFTMRGTVTDPESRPVPGCLVVLTPTLVEPPEIGDHPEQRTYAQVATSDAAGAFAFPRQYSGGYWLYARSRAGLVAVRRVGFHDTDPKPAVLQLTRTRLSGALLDADGRTPVLGALVQPIRPNEPTVRQWGPFGVRTNAKGEFALPGLDPGIYLLEARTFDRLVARSPAEVSPEARGHIRMLMPGGSLRGVVLLPDKRPAAGIRVLASGSGVQYETNTGADGKFLLSRVLSGRYQVYAHGDGREQHSVTAEVLPERASPELRIILVQPRLVLRCLRPDGKPLANTAFHMTSAGTLSGGGIHIGMADAEGGITDELHHALPARYVIVAPGIGYAAFEVPVAPEGTPEIRHTVRLAVGAAVTGRVLEQGTNRGVGGVVVTPRQAVSPGNPDNLWNTLFWALHTVLVHGYPITAISRDGDGAFHLQALQPGEYELKVGSETRRLSLAEGQQIMGADFILSPDKGARSLAGRILLPDGRTPLTNTEVTLTDLPVERGFRMGWPRRPGVPRRVITDGEGRFLLYPVAAEEHWFTASAPGYGTSRQLTIGAQEGPSVEFVLRPVDAAEEDE